ncbi:MAG: hypothetical protein ACOCWA_04740 [Bacteroidota bacterium]
MKKVPYIIKHLSIYKMPGFPKGLESMNDLAANINIIAGANASGKSSTARVIQKLIWRENTKGLHAEGSVILDADTWEIKIDSEKTHVQRNGNEDEMTGLPSIDGHHRYMLSLHKLVEAEENDLADEIARQSIGGYDLDAVYKKLEFSPKPRNKSANEFKQLADAEKKYKSVRDQQRKLKEEEEKLNELKIEKEKAQQAARLSDFYAKVADYMEEKLEFSRLTEQMDTFPDSMKKLTGEEYKNIQDYESQIEEAKKILEQSRKEIEKSRKVLEKLTIPEEGTGEKTITEIENRLDRLTKLEHDILESDLQIARLKSSESIALKSIDESIDPAKWKGLSIDDAGGLDKMLQEAYQLLGEKEYLLSEIRYLEEEVQNYEKENQKSETITQGIKTLGEWLKEPGVTGSIPLRLVALISLLGIATAMLTFLSGWPGLLGLSLIIAVFLYAYFSRNKESDTLKLRKNDYLKSGLTPPPQWNPEDVVKKVEELIEKLKEVQQAERIRQRLKAAKDSLHMLQDRIDKINGLRNEWIKKIQTAPGFPETNTNDFSSIYWFLIQVRNWQETYIQRESLQAEKTKLEEEYRYELKKINTLFETSNFEMATDVTSGKAIFNELRRQESDRKDHSLFVKQKNEKIYAQNELIRKNEQKLSNLYHSLEIEEGDRGGVLELVKQLDDYKQKSKEHYAAKQAFSKKDRLLREHSLYNEHEPKIQNISVDQAQEISQKNKNISDQLEGIQKQITAIETRVQDKKKGHELEDVLSEKEEALFQLEQLYEQNLHSATGDLVINLLKKETQNQNRPKVFKRADEIFNRITNGRYELLLDEKEETNFRAYDTVLKLGQNLSELSTGTRVQLLLSVRLAYVETVESSIKLPLLADELLANSDDERAQAIIESLIEISRDGRQVFYFTAQADEIGKWMKYLHKQNDLKHKIIGLNGGTNNSYEDREFNLHPDGISLTSPVLPPNGRSHEEYGKIIGKQPFNLLTQNTNEISLWYLIEDVDLLFAFQKRGIKKWGQLESFYRHKGKIPNFDENKFNQAKNRMELLKRFQELYRRGRSLPIDRDVLENSGAISAPFIDKVADKLRELKGEPRKLVQALKNSEISRFRVENANQLEQYLMAQGYIDDQEALQTDEIIISLHAFISNSEMEEKDAESFLNRVLKP